MDLARYRWHDARNALGFGLDMAREAHETCRYLRKAVKSAIENSLLLVDTYTRGAAVNSARMEVMAYELSELVNIQLQPGPYEDAVQVLNEETVARAVYALFDLVRITTRPRAGRALDPRLCALADVVATAREDYVQWLETREMVWRLTDLAQGRAIAYSTRLAFEAAWMAREYKAAAAILRDGAKRPKAKNGKHPEPSWPLRRISRWAMG
jgi:hypothetical protein